MKNGITHGEFLVMFLVGLAAFVFFLWLSLPDTCGTGWELARTSADSVAVALECGAP